jgi:hypothetical protein
MNLFRRVKEPTPSDKNTWHSLCFVTGRGQDDDDDLTIIATFEAFTALMFRVHQYCDAV